ncbi:MAG: hypothetical protein OCD76_25400, partial [Reichenbachiella sp.]
MNNAGDTSTFEFFIEALTDSVSFDFAEENIRLRLKKPSAAALENGLSSFYDTLYIPETRKVLFPKTEPTPSGWLNNRTIVENNYFSFNVAIDGPHEASDVTIEYRLLPGDSGDMSFGDAGDIRIYNDSDNDGLFDISFDGNTDTMAITGYVFIDTDIVEDPTAIEAVEFIIRSGTSVSPDTTGVYARDTFYIQNLSYEQVVKMSIEGDSILSEGSVKKVTLSIASPHMSNGTLVYPEYGTATYGDDFIIYDSARTPDFYNEISNYVKWSMPISMNNTGDTSTFEFFIEALTDSVSFDFVEESIRLWLKKPSAAQLENGLSNIYDTLYIPSKPVAYFPKNEAIPVGSPNNRTILEQSAFSHFVTVEGEYPDLNVKIDYRILGDSNTLTLGQNNDIKINADPEFDNVAELNFSAYSGTRSLSMYMNTYRDVDEDESAFALEAIEFEI